MSTPPSPAADTNYLRELSGGTGYDDVICFAPVRPVVEQAGDILGFDGCLNFFAGPTNSQFKAEFNCTTFIISTPMWSAPPAAIPAI